MAYYKCYQRKYFLTTRIHISAQNVNVPEIASQCFRIGLRSVNNQVAGGEFHASKLNLFCSQGMTEIDLQSIFGFLFVLLNYMFHIFQLSLQYCMGHIFL